MNDPKQDGKEKQLLSRREALKALTAATGAVAISSLPKKWETPIIEIGALPAHAQCSPLIPPEITRAAGVDMDRGCYQPQPGRAVQVTFSFTAPYGAVSYGVIDVTGVADWAPNGATDQEMVSGDEFGGTVQEVICVEDPELTIDITVAVTNACDQTATDTFSVTMFVE